MEWLIRNFVATMIAFCGLGVARYAFGITIDWSTLLIVLAIQVVIKLVDAYWDDSIRHHK